MCVYICTYISICGLCEILAARPNLMPAARPTSKHLTSQGSGSVQGRSQILAALPANSQGCTESSQDKHRSKAGVFGFSAMV